MKFYSVYEKKTVDVPETKVKVVKLKNGRFQAQGKDAQGRTLYKFVKGE